MSFLKQRSSLWRSLAAGLVGMFLLAFPWLGTSSYQHHLLTFVFLYIALSSSWNIIGGYAGYVSLGHAFFFGVGAYTVAILLRDFPFLAEISQYSPFFLALVGGLVAAAFGLVFGWLALRTRGSAFVIVTITLLLMGDLVASNLEITGGSFGITLPLPTWGREFFTIPFFYALLALAVTTVWSSYKIKHSKFGMGLIAIREDEGKASMVGINTTLYKVVAFALSTLFVGIAGGMWVYSRSYINPAGFINLTISGNMIIMTLLGGRGTLWGPVIGASLLSLGNQAILAEYGTTELNRAILGFAVVLVVVMFPGGIVGLFMSLRAKSVGLLRRRGASVGAASAASIPEGIQESED